MSEKQRLSEMDDKITTAKDLQLSLREKDEQIRDLTNELKILQQHNNELISLSSKFGQVEVENIELKRKVSEYAQDNQNLKSTINSEKADHAALRTANDKLVKKIEELQKNIDSLKMQLMVSVKKEEAGPSWQLNLSSSTHVSQTFQNEEEKYLVSKSTQTEIKLVDKKTGTSFLYKNESVRSEEDKKSVYEAEVDDRKSIFAKKKSADIDFSIDQDRNINNSGTMTRNNNDMRNPASPSMSREKILMFLDQAQISTPLEAQNAARMRQIDVSTGQNDASKYPESYRQVINLETLLFGNSTCFWQWLEPLFTYVNRLSLDLFFIFSKRHFRSGGTSTIRIYNNYCDSFVFINSQANTIY